jgi:ribosomal protein L21
LGIEYPPKQHEQFAIIQVDGFQYKVLEDTILILDTKKDHSINEPVIIVKGRSFLKAYR